VNIRRNEITLKETDRDVLARAGFDSDKLVDLSANGALPGVVFAMRYPDDTGFVWNTIARTRDLAASHLHLAAKCFIAYPKLSGFPAYQVQYLQPVALEFHSSSAERLADLEKFILENSVRVVVFMSALPSTLNLAFFKRLGVATINTENDGFNHSLKDRVHIRLMKYVVRKVLKKQVHSMHLANAEAQFDFLLGYAKIPRARLALVRDAVDHEHFIPGIRENACKSLGLDPSRIWIISVAQARPEKRVDLIIRAVKRAIEARPFEKIGFIFVGDGECVRDWKHIAIDLTSEDQIHFAGRQDNLVPYYQAAALMVHASKRESFGLAVVEAMSCELPVVATRSAGPNETILHGVTGTLVDPDDFEDLVDNILRYVDNADLRDAHGKAARHRVVNRYGMARQGQDLAGHIKRFLDN
jgi:glycosyltransferase involved in cell wall biosynthesis